MKKLKYYSILTIILFIFYLIGCRTDKKSPSFDKIIDTYYKDKNINLVSITISHLNSDTLSYEENTPVLIGFYGEIFSKDTIIKSQILKNLEKIDNSDYKKVFEFLASTDIDTIYKYMELSPGYNDMLWSSFSASGNTKYIDKIIKNTELSSNREDINLFFTGGTAKWSLSSVARQDSVVKSHLLSLKDSIPIIDTILAKEPEYFNEEMTNMVNEQKMKGILK
jgi:hypothetical protein